MLISGPDPLNADLVTVCPVGSLVQRGGERGREEGGSPTIIIPSTCKGQRTANLGIHTRECCASIEFLYCVLRTRLETQGWWIRSTLEVLDQHCLSRIKRIKAIIIYHSTSYFFSTMEILLCTKLEWIGRYVIYNTKLLDFFSKKRISNHDFKIEKRNDICRSSKNLYLSHLY